MLLIIKSFWREDSDQSFSVSKAGWSKRKLWVLNREIFCHMPYLKKKKKMTTQHNFAFGLLTDGKLCCLEKAGDRQKIISLHFVALSPEETSMELTAI